MDSLPPGIDLSQIPAGVPPPGVLPNFVDPPSQSWIGRLSVYTTLPPMVLFFVLRVYVRLIVVRRFGADDYLCVLAAAFTIGFSCMLIPLFLNDTWGRHLWDIPVIALNEEFLKSLLVLGILYNFAAMFIKLSFFALYFRLFQPIYRVSVMIWAGIVTMILFYCACTAVVMAYCLPRSSDGGWVSTSYNERCGVNYLNLNAAAGLISALTDFYVLAIPIIVVRKLNLTPKKRIGVTGIFLTGFLASAFAVAGVVYRFEDIFLPLPDYTWYSMYTFPLAVAELNVGIICCCMPVIFVLFRGLLAKTESFWVSLVSYLGPRSKLSGKSASEGSADPPGKIPTGELPQVPRGTLNTLASFVRKGTRFQGKTNRGQETRASTYVELQSVDNYHAYVQGEHRSESTKSLRR
ncbi:hypothetical protein GGS23DRAFT_578385 [Durotheca rogersii]|uniref:uncharacterized protein n=1 Tax=Durotheca rogersii TaxID=419775 RepID=UPI00221EB731|nr:uncharacterized protein GGS23DRAFT_578385 [Durotheca rogersii]KAI5861021.1 hypothetical protein GGS23DRAFT_578385 [Durotheca rogersii]